MKFNATILQTGKNTTGIHIPEDLVAGLGAGKKPPIKVTIKGYIYRTTVGFMDGKSMISLSAENRNGAGVQGGDQVEVSVELDTEPRTFDLPADLAAALTAADATAAFQASAPSMRKEYVRQVESAKAQETRERRIAKIVEKLTGK